jgi:molybdopterin molybdotransferase
MLEFITLELAQKLILERIAPVKSEVLLLEQTLGRVLAQEVKASLDIPPFDRSPLDGYAVRGEDLIGDYPVSLNVIGEAPAGSPFIGEVIQGTSIKILTGSPLPKGANAVVRQEDTEEKFGQVKIHQGVKPGSNISRQGEDISAGEVLFKPGTEITPAVLGILASQGIDKITVYTKPRIAVASSGDELRNVGSELGPGQIYNSNFYTLSGMIREWGGEPVGSSLSQDKAEELGKVINSGLDQADLVVTTGGASVGEYDVTLRALVQAEAKPLFWRVALKPGTPVLCGVKEGKIILGLSGNPAAAMISAALLLGPAVRKLAGFTQYFPKKVLTVSDASFSRTSGVTRLIRAIVKADNAGLLAVFPDQQQPGVLKSMLGTNALVSVPAGSTLEKGERCSTYLLKEWEEEA